jgi:hypothetical protein
MILLEIFCIVTRLGILPSRSKSAESYNKQGKRKTLGGKLRLWADESSSSRNLHFAVGAGLCSIYRSCDPLYVLGGG